MPAIVTVHWSETTWKRHC